MKELPFFRFTVTEWLNDDISFESYTLKGLFADVCAYYWFKDCSITLARLERRFKDATAEIHDLIESDIIKVEEGEVTITFLDRQFEVLLDKHLKAVEAGRKGGLSKAKAKLKQSSSYKYKDKDKYKDKEVPKQYLKYDTVISFFDPDVVNHNTWQGCYDKLVRLDGYTEEQILDIVKEFRAKGNWWRDNNNFETLLKLRNKNKEGIKFVQVFEKSMPKKKTYNIN